MALWTESLTRRFQQGERSVLALDRIDLTVQQGEFVSVIGRSGCGKSTLVRLLAGLDTPSTGKVVIAGRQVEGPGADRGMVFQKDALFPWLTVAQNICFGLNLRGAPRAEQQATAAHWLEIVGLSAFAESYPDQLSGGMRQRIALARALANRPRILLMDEPFGALDAQTRTQMQLHLEHVCASQGVTTLLVTHDLDEAVFLADRVVVLSPRPGRVEEILEIRLPRPRPRGVHVHPTFLSARRHIDQLIHAKER